MKKLTFAVSLLLSVMISVTVFADSSWLAVPAYYHMWADMYFEVKVDDEIRGPERNSENLTVQTMDKVSTYTNPETLNVEKISLIFHDANITYSSEMVTAKIKRAMSFFCAIEAGNLLNITSDEIRKGVNKALEIYVSVEGLTDAQYEKLWNGEYIKLCDSVKGAYYIHYEYNSRYLIYFFPNGSRP